MRQQIFDRWQADPEAFQSCFHSAAELHQWITLAQEQDALLLQKTKRHLTEVWRQLTQITESKRIIDAYGRSAIFSNILPRCSI